MSHHQNEDGYDHHLRLDGSAASYSAAEYHSVANLQFEGPAPCAVCYHQQVPFHGAACSRRCDWVMHSCCPQCGRGRSYGSQAVFCGSGCAGQARQANWCLGCGVRQVLHGQPSCMNASCIAVVDRINTRINTRTPHAAHTTHSTSTITGIASTTWSTRGSGRRGSDSSASSGGGAATGTFVKNGPVRTRLRIEPHQRLTMSDKLVGAVRQQVGGDVAKRLTAVIKAGGPVDARKLYTAYRCRVEHELNEACGVGAPKFGAGGEGNEQRRFIPLSLSCDGLSTSAADAELRTCRDPHCQACSFVDGGISAAFPGAETVPAFSSASKAAGTSKMVVLLVCRVTVGNPRVVLGIEGDDEVPATVGRVPLEELVHSNVVKYPGFDVAHVPAARIAAAVDVQFMATVGPAPVAPAGPHAATRGHAAFSAKGKRAPASAADRASKPRTRAAPHH